jgi:hypothetical protein
VNQILGILEQIRNVVSEQEAADGRFSGHDAGAVLAVALDTAEDAGEAMLAYEVTPFQEGAFGENYLRLYGFLQAAFLQEDAIAELSKHYVRPIPDTRKMAGWVAIRELRNRAIGHPVKHKRTERIFITRVSVTQWSFRYHIWDDNVQRNVFDHVNLKCLYEAYKRDAATLLCMILDAANSKNERL